ncbi:adult cuticle protein 1 [Drosophila bipectinata]|uniref:adult cuticle protein 1 n=1 Tax=Drosophila bipectinata TaxID=42026 RepID=UPI0007E6E6BD|nr:adult cuticle protein 1 [Drosophila bipectinata]
MSVSYVSIVAEITEANMKFAVVVVLFALAWGVNCSVVPLLTAAHGGVVIGAPAVAGSVAIQASAVPAAVPLAIAPQGPVLIQSGPAVVAAPAPAVVAAHAPVVLAAPAPAVVAVAAPEASYVAKTRGAVHVAPLPGHIQSAASVNLEPAPGTL